MDKREKNKIAVKKYYYKNRDKCIQRSKEYNSKNREKILEYKKEYRKKNRKKLAKYKRDRYNKDINFRLADVLRSRIRHIVKGSIKVGSAVRNLGCTIDQLKKYLESKFIDGMSWENYGEWHIDHIVPLSSFDLTDKKQFLEACHYSNLQPLWAIDNLLKSDK